MKKLILMLLIAFLTFLWSFAAISGENLTPTLLDTESPNFYVAEGDVDLQASRAGLNLNTDKRFADLNIGNKALEMITNASKTIIASAFLFDTINANGEIKWDAVAKFTRLLIKKKHENPDMKIVFILDPINSGYGGITAPAVNLLVAAGIDVVYSDLLPTKSATAPKILEGIKEGCNFVDKKLTRGVLGDVVAKLASFKIPKKTPISDEGISPYMAWNAASLKANHRKLLVTDAGDSFESLITSANPHNASVPNENYAITVKGDVGKYMYMTMREDVKKAMDKGTTLLSAESQKKKKDYFSSELPPIDMKTLKLGSKTEETPVSVKFVTENKIKQQILAMLKDVKPEDDVRLQMFYLSDYDVVDAIVEASKKLKKPMRIILDPNKDAFGSKKDGTPNRQVASYLLEKKKELGLNLNIRWYDTQGEQNHAKIMSVTNRESGKFDIINGSANWTGKNLKTINMESDVVVKGSEKVVSKYNGVFDNLWTNGDGMHYTIGFDENPEYATHAGMWKWAFGERTGYVSW